MNKENAKEYLPLVQALAEGKTIQYKQDGIWKDPLDLSFSLEAHKYRIKPEPRTFEVWRNLETGHMFSSFNPSKEARNGYERITVREVLE